MVAPVSLASTGALLSSSAVPGAARQAVGVLVQPMLLLYARVVKWSPACGECKLASGARSTLMGRGMSASVSRASAGASLSWSTVRDTARQAVAACVWGVRTCWKGKGCAHEKRSVGAGISCAYWRILLSVDCARHSATSGGGCWCNRACTRGEGVACVRGARTCWKGKGCAHEKRGVSAGVSCEHWCFPLLVGRIHEARRDRQWWFLVLPLFLLYARAAKGAPACGEYGPAESARGALMRRGMGAGVSCELWCFPLLVGCARHSATGSGGCWCSLCGTCGEVVARGQGGHTC